MSRLTPVLAGAAAIVLLVPAAFLAWQATHRAVLEPLGTYSMELHGSIQEMRGPVEPVPTAPYEFAPGMTFDLNLFPEESVAGPIEVVTFVSHDEEGFTSWRVPVERSDEGAVRIAGRVGTEIVLPAGTSRLLVAIGRANSIPRADELNRRLSADGQSPQAMVQERDWAAWTLRVRVVGNPVP
jgi:hypothetical protein